MRPRPRGVPPGLPGTKIDAIALEGDTDFDTVSVAGTIAEMTSGPAPNIPVKSTEKIGLTSGQREVPFHQHLLPPATDNRCPGRAGRGHCGRVETHCAIGHSGGRLGSLSGL